MRRRWTPIWRNRGGRNRREWKGYLFLLPSLAGVSVFIFLPFLDVIRRSFFRAVGSGFVGMDNYIAVFQNEAFALAVRNTVRFMGICIPLLLILSLAAAVILEQIFPDRKLVKTGFLLPMAIPAASAVVCFRLVFDKSGWLNVLLGSLGLDGQDWLGSDSAFWVLTACYIWKNLGYDMILWMAGLCAIPGEQYDAARVQGAGRIACFWYITLPQLKETAFVTALLSLVNAFRVFREAYLVAGDYPHESIYMLQHLFNNWFTALDIQKMTAAATLLVLFTGGILALNEAHQRRGKRQEEVAL